MQILTCKSLSSSFKAKMAPTQKPSDSTMSENERKRELQEFDDSKTGVKGLAESGLQKIPRIFIDEQYVLERKSISDKHEFVFPVIDLECLNTDRGRIIDQVRDACGDWGFFKVVNHGIPTSLMEETIECVRRFHELDAEKKKEFYSRDFKKKVMYHSNYDLHHAPSANWRDTLYLIMAPQPPQPQELPQVCR